MDPDTLELCKENIQPLKQGRRASKLGLALRALSDVELRAKLQKEREEHEMSIMTYDGNDPLQPRHDYVNWIEQSCPKHGKEVNLIPLLEDTIMQFKEVEQYKQDSRFIDLIIKYIESQENPIELFQMVYSQGLGTKCASFYKAWADQFDANNDLNRADQVFNLGLSSNAEPREVIEEAHTRFQLSVGRRMLTGQLTTDEKSVSMETAERQRKVLGRIKKGGSVRPSSGLPGTIPISSDHLLQNGNIQKSLSIYQEDENGLPIVQSISKLKVHAENTNKENTLKPSSWIHHNKKTPMAPAIHSTPNFQVLKDDDIEETPSRQSTLESPVPANVLRAKKLESKHKAEEILKTSLHKSLSKPQLPIVEAFAGGKEFCFEELRWAFLNKRMTKKRGEENYMRVDHLITPCKSSLVSPTPTLPTAASNSKEITFTLSTPASSCCPIYPILEYTQSSRYNIEETASLDPSKPVVSRRCTNEFPATPNVIYHTDEDGVYAIPSTPADHHGLPNFQIDRLSREASACPKNPEDTPSTSQIIVRPKAVKPAKITPFVVFQDEADP